MNPNSASLNFNDFEVACRIRVDQIDRRGGIAMKLSGFFKLAFFVFIILLFLVNTQPGTVEAVSGSNLSYGAAGWQSDSNYSTAYGGDKAKDGVVSVTSKWCSNGASPTHWLGYDLGSSKSVNGFVVKHAGAAGEPSYMNTKYFKFQAADSWSGPWNDVTPQIDNSAQNSITTYNISPSTMRYVRLYITNPGIDNYARIPEFEIWGNANTVNNADIQQTNSSVPTSINPGETKAVTVRVYNNGSTTWSYASLYRLGATPNVNQLTWSAFQNGGYMTNTSNGRAYLNSTQSIPPGGSWDFRFNITAPANASGTLNFSVQMVQDNVQWFGETYTWPIQVGGVSTASLRGVHWVSDNGLRDFPPGWNVETVIGVDNQGDIDNAYNRGLAAKNRGWQNIIRIDYQNYRAVPTNSNEYEAWAQKFFGIVNRLKPVSNLFIAGNEPNIEGPVSPAQYVAAFNYLYNHGSKPSGIQLLIAGPATFSPDDYSWLDNVARNVSNNDGFALHTYVSLTGAAYEPDPRKTCVVPGKLPPNGQGDCSFQRFRNYTSLLTARWSSKPVYITEFNSFGFGSTNNQDPAQIPIGNYSANLMQNAYEAIRTYNQQGNSPRIYALCWFVDQNRSPWAGFSLDNNSGRLPAARQDFINANVSRGF